MILLTNLTDPEYISKALDVMGNSDYIIKSDIHNLKKIL